VGTNVKLFYPELQKLVGGRENMDVAGRTVGECLEDLVRQYPEARKLLFDGRGRLLKQVYVYVNAESLEKADFTIPLTERDELILAVLVTGG
jgi:hypothetical protein